MVNKKTNMFGLFKRKKIEAQALQVPTLLKLGEIWMNTNTNGAYPTRKYLLIEDTDGELHLLFGIADLHEQLLPAEQGLVKAIYGGGKWDYFNGRMKLHGASSEYKEVDIEKVCFLFDKIETQISGNQKIPDVYIKEFSEIRDHMVQTLRDHHCKVWCSHL